MAIPLVETPSSLPMAESSPHRESPADREQQSIDTVAS